MDILANGQWLPLVFAALMGIAILLYVILDGFDLGVGILMGFAKASERDVMIASIGPFWDANETWLVLGIGILLVAFPQAHGIVLTGLYLPVAVMLGGLIVRGVAFDFRAKAQDQHKRAWDRAFVAGSSIATFAQGYMLALYIVGFERSPTTIGFALLAGLCLMGGYCLVGASWLILKTEGALQLKAIRQARRSLWAAAAGMALVSIATPLVSPRVFERWFQLPEMIALLPIPAMTVGIILLIELLLRRMPRPQDRWNWVPFAGSAGLFVLCFQGLAYSFYPYVVPERLTIWEAASAPESLMIILVGTAVVLPCILGYTIFAYKVFWGKVGELRYD